MNIWPVCLYYNLMKTVLFWVNTIFTTHFRIGFQTLYSVSRSCFYYIRALHQIRGALDNSTAASVASALVSARLDYVNSIYGTSTKQITRLQRVQNALARIVSNRPPDSSSFHLLKQLHWLPIEWRIKFTSTSRPMATLESMVAPLLRRNSYLQSVSMVAPSGDSKWKRCLMNYLANY